MDYLVIANQLHCTWETEALVEIATIQEEMILRLKQLGKWGPEMTINKQLLSCSVLFNDIAMKFELYDMQLILYSITQFQQMDLIKASWVGLLRTGTQPRIIEVLKRIKPSMDLMMTIFDLMKDFKGQYTEEKMIVIGSQVLSKQEMQQIWSKMNKEVDMVNKYY